MTWVRTLLKLSVNIVAAFGSELESYKRDEIVFSLVEV